MTFTFEETTKTRKWLWVTLTLTILITFLLVAQNAKADGLDFEAVVVQADPQRVDVDGDGRLETFSADYTVYEDGTADGVVYIDNEPVNIERGAFGLTAEGKVYVDAAGVMQHEVGHTLGFRHEHTPPAPGGGDDDPPDCLIWDIDTAGVTHSFMVHTLISHH